MYYNSNKDNNNYYNSYKKEVLAQETYKRKELIQKIIKLILTLSILILSIVSAFYLYKYFNPTLNNLNYSSGQEKISLKNKPISNIIIREEELPKSIQSNDIEGTNKSNKMLVSNMNEKDIELIVKIIMSQMNAKVEKTLEKQLNGVNDRVFVNKSLKKTNNSNKAILTKKSIKNDSLTQLNNRLPSITNEKSNLESNYEQKIQKEANIYQNEMRVIIVQQGDTLSDIAKKAYGNKEDYQKILMANPEIIKNPNQIYAGQRLLIPS